MASTDESGSGSAAASDSGALPSTSEESAVTFETPSMPPPPSKKARSESKDSSGGSSAGGGGGGAGGGGAGSLGSPILQHGAYHCPGLHGPESRMSVFPMSFAKLLGGEAQVIIPLFQRTYCWTEVLFAGWWRDTLAGRRTSTPDGSHGTGKIVSAAPLNRTLV